MAIKTIGIARLSTKAAAKPNIRTIQEKTATKMAKLMLDSLPANASAITFPTKAVISRVKINWAVLRPICEIETMIAQKGRY